MAPNRDIPMNRMGSLDLLRLVAALAVVAFHFFYRGQAVEPHWIDSGFPELAPVAIYGYLGVHLFFVISGFVIAWSAEGRGWYDFAAARFGRLYPGFLLCMTLTYVVLAIAADPNFAVSPAAYGANLFIFSPALGQPFIDGVYWSIVMELIFYGWVALALATGLFGRAKLVLIGGWLLISAANELVVHDAALRLLFITEYAPWFAIGMLAQHARHRGVSGAVIALFALALALSFNNLLDGQRWMLANYGEAIPLPALMLANVGVFALFGIGLALSDRVPSTPLVLALGGLTYPLYLLHQNIGYVALNLMTPSIRRYAAVGVTLAVITIISWAIWRFYEKPARKLSDRLFARLVTLVPFAASRPVAAHR